MFIKYHAVDYCSASFSPLSRFVYEKHNQTCRHLQGSDHHVVFFQGQFEAFDVSMRAQLDRQKTEI